MKEEGEGARRYIDGTLYIEQVEAERVIEEVNTPVYCYSLKAIRDNFAKFLNGLSERSLVCYAVKANPNVAIIKAIAQLGGGADVVSEGEIRLALAAGVPPEKIVFSGVGKTEAEINYAADVGVALFNVESIQELELLNKLACAKGRTLPVALRVNPGIDAKTHPKITTGKRENKFGIPESLLDTLNPNQLGHVSIVGLSAHVGSQICDIAVFKELTAYVRMLAEKMKNIGCEIVFVDVGGGLGVSYQNDQKVPSIEQYTEVIRQNIPQHLGYRVVCEPGRAVMAKSGYLLTRVLYTKDTGVLKHVIVDAGMNDLVRPALYDAYHEIIPVKRDEKLETREVDIVGPICESSDIFARNRPIQELKRGDFLAICDVGAYGVSLSSSYNSRLSVPEVLINKRKFVTIKNRGTYKDLINQYVLDDSIYS